jgi:Carboxypeptidase regulatory-like domain
MKRGVRFFKSLRFVSVLFSLLALCVTIAFGQAISGNLVGTVSDPSSAVVSNAEVTATNVGTGATATASTNATGEYRFDNLPVGTYKITVKVQGFRTTVEQTDVELNKTGTRNIRVTPGAATETVEVTGAAPTIDTTTAQLQSTFDPQYSQDLGLTSTGGRRRRCSESFVAYPGRHQRQRDGRWSGSVGGRPASTRQ